MSQETLASCDSEHDVQLPIQTQSLIMSKLPLEEEFSFSPQKSSYSLTNSNKKNKEQIKPILLKSKFLRELKEKTKRTDRFGNEILAGSKRHHISVGISEVHDVESFKEYNQTMNTVNDTYEFDIIQEDEKCQNMCNIF